VVAAPAMPWGWLGEIGAGSLASYTCTSSTLRPHQLSSTGLVPCPLLALLVGACQARWNSALTRCHSFWLGGLCCCQIEAPHCLFCFCIWTNMWTNTCMCGMFGML
jgi:hypothetical protein